MPANLPRNKQLLPNAKVLRKNMTKEERHLWYDCLRFCKPRFRRQEIIGNYIADFFCHKAGLVVELDGAQHYEPFNTAYDNARTAYFLQHGITVMRFTNLEIQTHFRRSVNVYGSFLKTARFTPQSALLTAPLKGSLKRRPLC